MKINKQNIMEKLLMFGIFFGGLIPLRLIFYQNFSHYWLGSVGVLSLFTFMIYYLSKKNKLGRVGVIIIKRLHSRAKSKIGLGFIVFSSIIIYFMSFVIIGCISADPNTVKLFNNAETKEGITSLDQNALLKSLNTTKDIPIEQMPYLMFIAYTPNPLSFALMKSMDNLSNGWLYSIALVMLVEEIEFLGILCYFRYKANPQTIVGTKP